MVFIWFARESTSGNSIERVKWPWSRVGQETHVGLLFFDHVMPSIEWNIWGVSRHLQRLYIPLWGLRRTTQTRRQTTQPRWSDHMPFEIWKVRTVEDEQEVDTATKRGHLIYMLRALFS
jgi:hypothetical protein